MFLITTKLETTGLHQENGQLSFELWPCTLEYDKVEKRNVLELFALTWMTLKNVLLSNLE